MPIRIRLLSLLCLAHLFLHGQVAKNIHIENYTTENGLPSNGIKGLRVDETTGFLWVATEGGIVRFNGVDFRTYTRYNTSAIGAERMLFITRNLAGVISITDLSGNVLRVDQNRPVRWKSSRTGINSYFDYYSLVNVSDTLFNRFFGKKSPEQFSPVSEMTLPASDTSCFIVRNGTLLFFSYSMEKAVPVAPGKKIRKAFKIGNRFYVIDRENELYEIGERETLRPAHLSAGPDDDNTRKEFFIGDKLFWEPGMSNPVFFNRDKAWLVKEENGLVGLQLIYQGLPTDIYIKSVEYSIRNGILFIGTDSKGLIVVRPNKVLSLRPANYDPRTRNSYYSQIELDNGSVLTNEGVVIGDKGEYKRPLPIEGKFAYTVSNTGDSCLWYSRYNPALLHNTMYRYNMVTRQTDVFPEIQNESIVLRTGNGVFLANINGLYRLENTGFRQLYRKPKHVVDNMIYDMKEDANGDLLMATCAGVLRFQRKNSSMDTVLARPLGCIRSIWKYKDYCFFGSYGAGYYAYHNGKVHSMPLDKNKYLLYTHCFMPDEQGFCWMSTNRGLFKASLAEMLRAADNETNTIYYHYFGKKDGMDMTELNGGCLPCAIRLKNGTLSFPSMDGLLWVDPAKADPMLPAGDIFVDEVVVDEKPKDLDWLTSKSLPHKTGEIAIWLTYSAWCNKENIYLEYQLNDTLNWKRVDIDKEPVIRFNNLTPGNYTLRIRKLNGFGANDHSFKIIRFSIQTPWQQQWWFYALCTVAFIGLIYVVLAWRTRQYKIQQHRLERQVSEKTRELQQQNEILEKNNSIKTRLISIISHDIVTPLKFLTAAGKNLLEKRNQMPEELQQETIAEMTNTSQELQLLSTNILNWIKYQNENRRLVREHFNVRDLVKQVIGILNSLAVQKQLKLVNAVPEKLEVYQFYEPLKILVYNLLTNAISFSEKSDIVVSAVSEEGQVRVSVSDQGTGMTPEQVQRLLAEEVVISSANVDNKKGHGLGYLIIKDLIKTMGARLQIDSRKGAGTTVSIVLAVSEKPENA